MAGRRVRILGIDPGLTRCGVGVIDMTADRRATLVDVLVLRSTPDAEIADRLHAIGSGLERLLAAHAPDAVALERVFAQHNLRTVMGVAQISGVALHLAASRGVRVGMHTPSEVKAAVTGYGDADKRQVGTMVARVLGLAEAPKPADASDALALAICHGWRSGVGGGAGFDTSAARAPQPAGGASGATPAQQAWRDAEKSAGRRRFGA